MAGRSGHASVSLRLVIPDFRNSRFGGEDFLGFLTGHRGRLIGFLGVRADQPDCHKQEGDYRAGDGS